jgi:hypothetical protein
MYAAPIGLGIIILNYFLQGRSYINGELQYNPDSRSLVFSVGIGIVIAIIFCTFTILDEIKKKG